VPSRLHRKLNYANVVATLALFIALGGASAFAATHHRRAAHGLTRPQVVRVIASYLKSHGIPASGAAGATGAAGTNGADGTRGTAGSPGAPGPAGVPGPAGPATSLAPSGLTQTGVVVIGDEQPANGFASESVSYPMHLASEPTVEQMSYGQTDAHCQGSRYEPTAAPGYLCFYLAGGGNADSWGPGMPYFYPQDSGNLDFGAGRYGLMVTARAEAAGNLSVIAPWAVTAP
jgi:hypothetical protein